MNLNDYLEGQISVLSPKYLRAFEIFLDEYFHRTGSPEFAPENPERRVNFLKECAVNFWCVSDLWEIEAKGIEFNLQGDLDNIPDLTDEQIKEFFDGSLNHCERVDWARCDIHDDCTSATCLGCGGSWCDVELGGVHV